MRRVVAAGRMQHLVSIAAPKLAVKTNRAHLDESVKHYRKARAGLDELARGTPGRKPIHPQYLARLLSEAAADDAVFTADAGTPTIWAARYLAMNGYRGRPPQCRTWWPARSTYHFETSRVVRPRFWHGAFLRSAVAPAEWDQQHRMLGCRYGARQLIGEH
jgi:hypothetical protein